ncbi:hypothetical protein BVC80_393g12 [Macleaya cordata]|uniref:Uncharacterized protein n=1 Tax=Macleaya cordata TaxID=56857 RepID=A0A200R1C4_MACCD|nr:hypothetical protein BVC80_393g12 [Macleaya cordata]
MASLQVVKSNFAPPFLGFRSDLQRKSSWLWVGSDLTPSEKRILKLQSRRRLKFSSGREFRVFCRVREDEGESKGEEPPESLFMKELRRRGMTPTSLLEESNKSLYELGEETKLKEDDERGFSKRNAVSTDFEIGRLANQRERSMALNSEGLEVLNLFTLHVLMSPGELLA